MLRKASLMALGLRVVGGAIAIFAVSLQALCAQAPERSKGPSLVPDSASSGKSPTREKGQPADSLDYRPAQDSASSSRTISSLAKDFAEDQKQIWTSPARLRFSDTQWLVPLSGVTAGLFVTDGDFSKHLSRNPATISHYKTLSDASVAALIGGASGMWVLGHAAHNTHWSETGFLAGESALNSLVVVEGLKYSLRRERPFQGDGTGPFFQRGGTSFPSEHAAAAWSVAGVIAHEYPGPLTKLAAYGLASLVSFSRVRAHQHFPSDVMVGSLIGNLIAQDVYSRRHDPEVGGEAWRSISRFFRADGNESPANQGSPYVPLDSWIYPALDRLAALGLIDTGFAGMRPWTRNECVRLLNEAGERMSEGTGGLEAEKIYQAIEAEFRDERESPGDQQNVRARVESVYARVTGISGQPITDGNHFGQTLANDFGRPYQAGFNSVEGFSAWSTSGRWAGYVRAEYQHSPSAPAQPLPARQFIASFDGLPAMPPATPLSAVDRVRLLDAYVGLTFDNWQISFGKQSLWWSPMQGGPLMFSNNAEPVNIFRISRVSPLQLPSVLGLLGPIRFEWFLGQLEGHQFVSQDNTGTVGQLGRPLSRQPFLQGQKLSFKPSSNFEFSVSATVVFAGGPSPLTWHTLGSSYSAGGNSAQSASADNGDARSGMDFTYRVPGLRKWLTFYGDAFSEDEYSPLAYMYKSAFQGGLYLPQVPGVPKLDFRVEGGTTAPPDFPGCGGCFYDNNRYPDGSYVNNGNILGSSLGRGSQAERAWSTYWLTSRNKIQFQYRHQKVDARYLPHGGTLNDGGVNVELQVSPGVTFSGLLQYEKWNYPVLAQTAKSNWTSSIGLTFWPRNWALPGR